MSNFYESLAVEDVTRHVHNGKNVSDLLGKLGDEFDGQYVVVTPRSDFYVGNPLRLSEPQADVFGSRSSARKVVEALERKELFAKGYSCYQVTPHFLKEYEHRKRKVVEKLGPVTRGLGQSHF